ADVCAGRNAAMYAWRRTNVDALNRLARHRFALEGRLTGPEVAAPGGRRYAVGDRIVTLAPAADGQVVTSERGDVVSVDVHRRSLIIRTDDGRFERLEGDELGTGRLAHGYAVTVHRSQGATVDVAHRYEDGGGRELAYVSMSRGREANTVHVIADSVDQAAEDLCRDWAVDHRARWAIDPGTPATDPLAVERDDRAPAGMPAALRLARLQAERQAVAAAIPPDPAPELALVERQLAELRRDRTHLLTGQGRYAGAPEGETARRYLEALDKHHDAQRHTETGGGWRERRRWRNEVTVWAERESNAKVAYAATIGPKLRQRDSHHPGQDLAFRPELTHVGPHRGLGHLGAVLLHQPLPHPPGSVPLLDRHPLVADQDRVDHRLPPAQRRRRPLRRLPLRRHRRRQRRSDRPTMHMMAGRQRPDPQAQLPMVATDTFELLHPRHLLPPSSTWSGNHGT